MVRAALLLVAALAAPADLAAQQSARRPFDHLRHERALACSECHGTGEQHRAIFVRTPTDCASCHHDPQRALSCTGCHARAELPGQRTLSAAMAITKLVGARSRELPFAHDYHANVACQECHRTPITLAMNRECRSCHEGHHRAEAQCVSCHASPPRQAHRAESHLSCAGSQCHAPAATPRPTESRTLCLSCHVEKREHEPAGSCATCHQIPGSSAAPSRVARAAAGQR